MITRDQVSDLREGDVVKTTGWYELSVEGRVDQINDGSLWLGQYCRLNYGDTDESMPKWTQTPEATLTVVSRAPRPLYVNHPRTEPVRGDVVADANGSGALIWMFAGADGADTDGAPWFASHDPRGFDGWYSRSSMPDLLRLLVDGETGEVVK